MTSNKARSEGTPTSFSDYQARADELADRQLILENQRSTLEALTFPLKPDWISDSDLYDRAYNLYVMICRDMVANAERIYELSRGALVPGPQRPF